MTKPKIKCKICGDEIDLNKAIRGKFCFYCFLYENWEEAVKEQHRKNQEKIKQELIKQYGIHAARQKIQNIIILIWFLQFLLRNLFN